MSEMVESNVVEQPSSYKSKAWKHFGFYYSVSTGNVFAITVKKKSQKRTKHSAINHLIHILKTDVVVVAAQCVCYSTEAWLRD